MWIKFCILLLVVFTFMGLIVWAIIVSRKQVIKDWETLDKLKERADSIQTKEEIEELYRDMLNFNLKLDNQYIKIELLRMDGFLRGLYKQYKTK